MPSLDEISRAGFSPIPENQQRDPVQEMLKYISSGVVGGMQKLDERPQKQIQEQNEKLKLYSNLRDQGYSPEEATKKVKQIGGTSFLERVLTGNRNTPFDAPSGDDSRSLAKRKAEADILNAEADVALKRAKATKYERNPVGGMSSEQLRKYRKDLLDFNNPDRRSEETLDLVDQINQKLKDMLGYVPPDDTDPATDPAASAATTTPAPKQKYAKGTTVYVGNKKYKVLGYRNGKLQTQQIP